MEIENFLKGSSTEIITRKSSQLSGFSKKSLSERLEILRSHGFLSSEDLTYLKQGGLKDLGLGEKFIENVIGYFQIPMGIVTNLRIDDRDRLAPMAVEETSIVAAASKTAKWVREAGSISTSQIGSDIIGQIQIAKVKNFSQLEKFLSVNEKSLVDLANNEVAFGLLRRGGGVRGLSARKILRPDGQEMAVIHIAMNPVDAMGANIINQVCEFLKNPIELATGEKVTMCILSNLVDTKLTRAQVIIDKIDPDLGEKIQEASLFAELDPYRAATNNKGVMNGIDPILIATGNDWRAVAAGVHAFAVRDGQYRSITKWRYDGRQLVGEFIAPIVVGIAGGVTQLHPTARMALKLAEIESAEDLSKLCAAVGLVQNLGALKALTTVGIIEGHMKLHIKNLSLGAGASEVEMNPLQQKLEEILKLKKRISLSHAIEALKELRSQL